jgi:hypothetical protein
LKIREWDNLEIWGFENEENLFNGWKYQNNRKFIPVTCEEW